MARVLPTGRWLLVESARVRRWLLVESTRARNWLLVETTRAKRWLLVESARRKRRLLVELARAKVVWPDMTSSLEFKVAILLFIIFTIGVAVLGFVVH
jgi:hypothetical protein